MRILLLSAAPCVQDGRPRMTARLLAALGHDVTLVCRAGDGAPSEERIGGARVLRADFDALGPLGASRSLSGADKLLLRVLNRTRRWLLATGWPGPARVVALAHEFWSVAAHADALAAEAFGDGQPDVVHAVGLAALPSAGRIAVRMGARLVYDAIELERDRNARYFRPLYHLRVRLERTWARRVDVMIAPSEEIGLQMRRDFGRLQVPVVHNVAAPAFSPAAANDMAADVRGALGLDPETRLAVYVGSAMRNRGLGATIRAIGRLPDWRLAVVGPDAGLFDARFADQIAAAGAAGRVYAAPARRPEDVASFIRTGDVSAVLIEPVCASYAFAQPNKLFQSVEAGLPVVVGRTPALRRTIARYPVGESSDDRDIDALAAAFVRQAARKHDAAYRNARARLLASHDAGAAAATWARVYATLAMPRMLSGTHA